MTSAVRYANKLTHFFLSCHECMMHKYKKQRLGVYPYWSSSHNIYKSCNTQWINTCDNKGSWARDHLLLATYNLYQLKTNKTHLKYYIKLMVFYRYIYLEFSNSNSKTKVKVSPINGMPFPIGLVYINNDLKKIIIYTLYF
jgi:hypothetical protein